MPSPKPDPDDVVYSPLPFLLAEEAHRDGQATEALFLTFNADLGFFERTALGACQSAGARITVVSDARVTNPDPRGVRLAGSAYVPGLAHMNAAFHPKVAVLAGPQRATVAVGSGNLSIAGWQYNSELWTVSTADTDTFPRWLLDLAEWLDVIAAAVTMGEVAAAGVRRTSAQLERLARASTVVDARHHLVHNTTAPIIEALPTGPVDELLMYAPFHDTAGQAVTALMRRFTPRQASVCIQPEMTVADLDVLRRLSHELGFALVTDDDPSRYRHGKLVEWAIGSQRWALTGSANLSGVALLQALSSGGNCEVGVISTVTASMFPASHPLADQSVTLLPSSMVVSTRHPTALTLLAATRHDGAVDLSLAAPAPPSTVVEVSARASDPETWTAVTTIGPGTSQRVELLLEGGSRVRLSHGTGADRRTGNTVFVTDPSAVQRRIIPGGTKVRTHYELSSLFTNLDVASEYVREQQRLVHSLAATRMPGPSGTSGPGSDRDSQVRLDEDQAGWQFYEDDTVNRLGTSLTAFGLALPELAGATRDTTVTWGDLLANDAVAALDDETPEQLVDTDEPTDNDDAPHSFPAPDLREASRADQRQHRRQVASLAALAKQLPVPERLIALRIVLLASLSGAWDLDNDDTWFSAACTATQSLSSTSDQPPRVEAAMASLAAVSLAVLHGHAPIHDKTDRTVEMDRTIATVEHLLPALDVDLIPAYCTHLRNADGTSLFPEDVVTTAAAIVQHDPVADAIPAIDDFGWEVHRHETDLLHVHGAFGNPTLAALKSVAAAQDAPLVGVWAQNTAGKWALVIWHSPDIFIIESGTQALLWKHYRLSTFMTPTVFAHTITTDPTEIAPYRVSHGAYTKPIPDALDALASLGLSAPHPPSDCYDG